MKYMKLYDSSMKILYSGLIAGSLLMPNFSYSAEPNKDIRTRTTNQLENRGFRRYNSKTLERIEFTRKNPSFKPLRESSRNSSLYELRNKKNKKPNLVPWKSSNTRSIKKGSSYDLKKKPQKKMGIIYGTFFVLEALIELDDVVKGLRIPPKNK